MLTQERLKELCIYNPDTGVISWKTSGIGRKLGASDAGTLKSNGYRRVCIDKKLYYSHRLAWLYMTGEWPKEQIDHINHIRDDNRWVNLRQVTGLLNNQNTSLYKNNKSGIVGVSLHKRDSKWQAMIRVNNIQIALGKYTDKFEAICARKSAEIKYGFHKNHGLNNASP